MPQDLMKMRIILRHPHNRFVTTDHYGGIERAL